MCLELKLIHASDKKDRKIFSIFLNRKSSSQETFSILIRNRETVLSVFSSVLSVLHQRHMSDSTLQNRSRSLIGRERPKGVKDIERVSSELDDD